MNQSADCISAEKTSTSNREFLHGTSFAARSKDRSHAPHLSISDDNHHVTETIGFLYGDEEDQEPKRSSLARSSIYSERSADGEDGTLSPRSAYPRRPMIDTRPTPSPPQSEQVNGQQIPHPSRSYSYERSNGQAQLSAVTSREQSPSE